MHVPTGKVGVYSGAACDYHGNVHYAWFSKPEDPPYKTYFQGEPKDLKVVGYV